MKIEERLELLSTAYLSKVFNDKDPSIHSELWESLLVFTKGMGYTKPTLLTCMYVSLWLTSNI